MYEKGFPVGRVAIICNSERSRARRMSERLKKALTSRGIRVVEDVKEAEAAVVVGGDGTLLRAFHQLGSLPILGVRDGTFGTMMELDSEELDLAVEMLSTGNFWLEKARTLEVREPEPRILALNEFLIRSGKIGKSSKLGIALDGVPISECICDGVIVATPTGSYAYNLAANGPVLDPRCDSNVVSYVAPWPPSLRPSLASLVIPSFSVVEVWTTSPYLYVVADGLSPVKFRPPLKISGSEVKAIFIRKSPDPTDFYRRLTRRMMPKVLTGILHYQKLGL